MANAAKLRLMLHPRVASPAFSPLRIVRRLLPCLVAVLLVAGCARTKVSGREVLVTDQLPRPGNVWVQPFAATPSDIPADSAIAGQYAQQGTQQSAQEVATGRKLGEQIASELVQQIREMGMPAKLMVAGSKPQVNDLILRGYLISVEEGSAKKRVTIGLGSGNSELTAAAEGLQVTPTGLRKLGSGSTNAGGSKTPGMAVGAATFLATSNPAGLIVSTGMKWHGEKSGKSKIEGRVSQTAKEIADILRKRFEDQGWIK